MNIKNIDIVLASASPRRREILSQVGLRFRVNPSDCEEIIKFTDPAMIVAQLSKDKASCVALKEPAESIVIGADTVVVSKGKILGKPKDREDAFLMLSELRNSCHSVYTGVTIIHNQNMKSFVCETKVYICDMTDEEIYSYIDTKDCFDKAGAYGIQGSFAQYVEKIEGDYYNVVGLPVSRLMYELKQL